MDGLALDHKLLYKKSNPSKLRNITNVCSPLQLALEYLVGGALGALGRCWWWWVVMVPTSHTLSLSLSLSCNLVLECFDPTN
jgi:hypothetical protein